MRGDPQHLPLAGRHLGIMRSVLSHIHLLASRGGRRTIALTSFCGTRRQPSAGKITFHGHLAANGAKAWSNVYLGGFQGQKNMPRACREYALTRLQGAKGPGWLAKELAQGARSLGLVSTTEGRRKDLSVSKCFLTTYDTTLFPVCEETQDPCPCVCAQCFYCVVVCVCRSQTPMMLQ